MNFFEKITDGLQLYQIIMLGAGILLFLTLIILLIVFATQRRSLKPLLLLFLLSIVMIGWPSIQTIKVGGDVDIELNKQIANYQKNPSPENRDSLVKITQRVEAKDYKNPAILQTLAKAQYVLGDNNKALITINKISNSTVQDTSIIKLKNSILLSQKLSEQLKLAAQNPHDSAVIKQLHQIRLEAEKIPIKNPNVEKNIRVAEQKVDSFKVLHPEVKIPRYGLEHIVRQ